MMKKMKFIKGMVIGTGLTIGAVCLYNGMNDGQRKRMMKQGKKMIRKFGII